MQWSALPIKSMICTFVVLLWSFYSHKHSHASLECDIANEKKEKVSIKRFVFIRFLYQVKCVLNLWLCRIYSFSVSHTSIGSFTEFNKFFCRFHSPYRIFDASVALIVTMAEWHVLSSNCASLRLLLSKSARQQSFPICSMLRCITSYLFTVQCSHAVLCVCFFLCNGTTIQRDALGTTSSFSIGRSFFFVAPRFRSWKCVRAEQVSWKTMMSRRHGGDSRQT